MKGDKFTVGDKVALSATFLRSLGTVSFAKGNSGLSAYDCGIGTVFAILPIGNSDLVDVWFDDKRYCRPHLKRINSFNLVHRKHINTEAHKGGQ